VEFVIDAVGEVEQKSVRVIKRLCPSCDDEAVRVVNSFPRGFAFVTIACQRKRLYDKEEGEAYARKRVQEVLADTVYSHNVGQKVLLGNENWRLR